MNQAEAERQAAIIVDTALQTFSRKLDDYQTAEDVQALIDHALSGMQIQGATGFYPNFVIPPRDPPQVSRRGEAEQKKTTLGFTVTSTGTAVAVTPSVITGLNTSFITPTMGGSELYADPAPSATPAADQWVFVRIEIEPVAEGSGPYTMSETSFTFESATIVLADDDSGAQQPAVDVDDGTLTNGIYLFPLAKLDADSKVLWQSLYGPFAAAWCPAGLKISAPVILHTGAVQTVAAP